MAANTGAAFSRGDLVREVRELKDRVKELETRRNLPHASYGSGGPRTRGGRFLAEDLGGEEVFEVTTEPPDIFMRPELISAVSAAVFAERIRFAIIPEAGVRTAGLGFDDLDTGAEPVGPTISNIPISSTGRALVILSASISPPAVPLGGSGDMSVEVSGATSVPAGNVSSNEYALNVGTENHVSVQAANVGVVENLNEGVHTFQCKYAALVGDTQFSERKLIVIAF